MNKTQPKSELFATKDYAIFKGIIGNRKVYPGHVAELTAKIAERNLLAQNPIVVTEDMRVLDGQHRLEAAKNNNWTIYYTIAEGGTLEDIQMLNSTSMPWKAVDYMESYIELGKEDYKILKEMMTRYKVSITNAAHILRGNEKGTAAWHAFKRGAFKIKDLDKSIKIFEALIAIRPYTMRRAWGDREFITALIKVGELISYDELIAVVDSYGERIEFRSTVRDYMRQFDEMYNFGKKKSTIRFY